MPSNDPEEPILAESHNPSDGRQLTGRESYNLVADMVAGVNFRMSDNLLQGLIILATVVVLAVVGAVVPAMNPDWDVPWYGGAMIGAFAGLVLGLIGSGVFLMIYRGVRHLRGKHD